MLRDQIIILLQGIIAFSMNAGKNAGFGVVPIAKSFLSPLSQPKVLKCLFTLQLLVGGIRI